MKGTRTRPDSKGDWDIEAFVPGTAGDRLPHAARGALFRVDGSRLVAPLLIRLGSNEAEIVCTGFAIGLDTDTPTRITTVALRDIPLQEIIAAIVRKIREPKTVAFYGDVAPEEAWGFLVGMSPQVGRVRPGRKGFSDQDLREFVREYDETLSTADRRSAVSVIARKQIPPVTAAAIRYRLKKAREFLKKDGRERAAKKRQQRAATKGAGR